MRELLVPSLSLILFNQHGYTPQQPTRHSCMMYRCFHRGYVIIMGVYFIEARHILFEMLFSFLEIFLVFLQEVGFNHFVCAFLPNNSGTNIPDLHMWHSAI